MGPREVLQGLFGERRRTEMSELCRIRRNEGYEDCEDAVYRQLR